MAESASAVLGAWSNFYEMTGSSAAALTGLMFVVITLVTGQERRRRTRDGISTFSTPTVLHFGAALLVSATLSAPWRSLVYPAALLGCASLYGLIYVLLVTLRTQQRVSYVPDMEDWTWYTILPLVAYAMILGGAIGMAFAPTTTLFAVAAGALLLIFIGIRNAWDVVTFLAIGGNEETPEEKS